MRLRIEDLRLRPESIPTLAEWHHAEWSFLHRDDSVERRIGELEQHLSEDGLPSTFVASADGEIAGSASLVAADLPERPELTPWLASVYVAAPFRRRGIGGALSERVAEKAARLGYPSIYLFTWTAERLYARLGWSVRERPTIRGGEVVVMKRDLTR